jgi:aryl-alcohol dehydrogenase-like predicted oxidoreductase
MANSKERAKQGVPYRTLGRTGEKVSAIGVGAPAGLRRQNENSMD